MKALFLSALLVMCHQLVAQLSNKNKHENATSFATGIAWDKPLTTNHIPERIIVELPKNEKKKRSPIGSGAWIGAVSGLASGAIIGASTYTPCEGWGCVLAPSSVGDAAVTGAILGAFTGTVVGVVTGLIIKLASKKR